MSDVLWAPSKPAHWDGASLRWLADIFAGGTPDKDNLDYWTNGTIPWLNSGSVNDWSIHEPSAHITRDAYAKSSAKWIPSHSIVIALAGQGKTKGMAARLEIDSTCNQSMAAIVTSASLEYRFLHFWLASNYQNIRNLAGGNKRDGLNLVHVGGIQVPLPPLDEQRAIANYLDCETQKIDELITEQRGLIETLRERRQAVIDRGAEYSVAERTRLRYLFAPSDVRNCRNEQVLSVYREYGVIPKGSREGNHNVTPEDVSRYLLVRPGDVVVNRMKAWQGSLGVSQHQGIVSGDYEVLRPTTDRLLPLFAHLYLRSARMVGQYVVRSTGIRPSQWRLYWKQMADIEIPIPSVRKQQEIVSFVNEQTSRIDELISESEGLISLSQERRTALITAAVTGQIDVRTAA